jgi:hypothetical protein
VLLRSYRALTSRLVRPARALLTRKNRWLLARPYTRLTRKNCWLMARPYSHLTRKTRWLLARPYARLTRKTGLLPSESLVAPPGLRARESHWKLAALIQFHTCGKQF